MFETFQLNDKSSYQGCENFKTEFIYIWKSIITCIVLYISHCKDGSNCSLNYLFIGFNKKALLLILLRSKILAFISLNLIN